jgi:hypothetical protein
MSGTGSKRAGHPSSRHVDARAKLLRRRLGTVEDELRNLVELNRALLHRLVDNESVAAKIYAAEFDRTDPKADDCEAFRAWKGEARGDFYLARRLSQSIYFVVGDATGHHAHAEGLKLFAVTALDRIFEEFARVRVVPEAIQIVNELDRWFLAPKTRMTKEANFTGGANIVVVRVDAAPDQAIAYASAGLPIYALGEQFERHGSFRDFDGVRFDPVESPTRKRGKIEVKGVDFLAIVTDGFRALGRRACNNNGQRSNARRIELFGDGRVKEALQQGYRSLDSIGQSPALRIVKALTEKARRFRRGFCIPEDHDDHRLVLIVDLQAIWRSETSHLRKAEPVPLTADGPADLVALKRVGKTVGKLTKCLP